MEFKLRMLDKDDYDNILVNWWRDWRWVAPPKEMLPENGTGGLMVTKDGRDICAGFIYFTNSKTAWSEWIISDFFYREDDREEAVVFLVNALTEICRGKGMKFVFTVVKNENLKKKYEQCGFVVGDENSTEMTKII